MNEEKQRIAIAEHCGWKRRRPELSSSQWIAPRGGAWNDPPDYLNDLNAMHEAEETMSLSDRVIYWGILWDITEGKWGVVHATAPQRAEAFLKTVGRWGEEE